MQSSLVLSRSIMILHKLSTLSYIISCNSKTSLGFGRILLSASTWYRPPFHLFSKHWQVMLATGWILPSFNGHSQGSIAFWEDWQGQVLGKLMGLFQVGHQTFDTGGIVEEVILIWDFNADDQMHMYDLDWFGTRFFFRASSRYDFMDFPCMV